MYMKVDAFANDPSKRPIIKAVVLLAAQTVSDALSAACGTEFVDLVVV